MAKFTAVLTITAAALTSVAVAHDGHDHGPAPVECAANVSSLVIATLENVTFFDTCANGSTYKFSTLLDAAKLPPTDLLKWCSSSACLGPLHNVMHEAPLTCLITYQGKAQNLTGEITELHDTCHKVKDAAKTPAPTPVATTTSAPATPMPSTLPKPQC